MSYVSYQLNKLNCSLVGIWLNFMATRAVQVSVSGMKWTEDGECICIVYENGSVMVGKIDGMKLWSVEQKHAKIPAVGAPSLFIDRSTIQQPAAVKES
jgi:hypothetical protein